MHDVLTDDQRLAIELRYFEFLPVEEVARHTGSAQSKVKMLCQGGLDRLGEVLTASICALLRAQPRRSPWSRVRANV